MHGSCGASAGGREGSSADAARVSSRRRILVVEREQWTSGEVGMRGQSRSPRKGRLVVVATPWGWLVGDDC